ncbi:MAG: hypothetical protein NPIRA04_31310 [Nitrospirales bacterium]|nr:MAG: hypothetical protein NPIRA04_31310 [Nitrospirales bacterium]
MKTFTVQLTQSAEKDLNRLSTKNRQQVCLALETLSTQPVGKPPRVKRLKGFGFPLYRLCSGDFRALFRIDQSVVTIMRVINRKALEETLRNLNLA